MGEHAINRTKPTRAIITVMVLSVSLGLLTATGSIAATTDTAVETPIRKSATLQATDPQTLRSVIPHPVPVLYVVPEGQVVKKGDCIVELDNTALTQQLADQQLRTSELEHQQQLASETLSAIKEEAVGELDLANQALSLAKMALDAYVQGEYSSQRGEAEDAVSAAGRWQSQDERV